MGWMTISLLSSVLASATLVVFQLLYLLYNRERLARTTLLYAYPILAAVLSFGVAICLMWQGLASIDEPEVFAALGPTWIVTGMYWNRVGFPGATVEGSAT